MNKFNAINCIDMIHRYVNIIKTLEKIRGYDVDAYKKLDIERVKLHDEILKLAGTDRNDKEFAFKFAQFVEDVLVNK